jgi:hypothetical protein
LWRLRAFHLDDTEAERHFFDAHSEKATMP